MIVNILLISSTLASASALASTSAFASESPPIQRVAIIGSGIAGLSLAHALENSENCAKAYTDALENANPSISVSKSSFGVQTRIYDSRPSLNFGAGAGIQLTGGKICNRVPRNRHDVHSY